MEGGNMFYIEESSYLVRLSHGCDEHLCNVGGVDCLCHEAWLDQSDLCRMRSSEMLDYGQ